MGRGPPTRPSQPEGSAPTAVRRAKHGCKDTWVPRGEGVVGGSGGGPSWIVSVETGAWRRSEAAILGREERSWRLTGPGAPFAGDWRQAGVSNATQ